MPYIKGKRQIDIEHGQQPENTGELNYKITRSVLDYLPVHPRYEDFNTVIGVLECAKQEFYRRMVAVYEDEKIKENGDVFPEI